MGTPALEGGFSAGHLASLTTGCTLFQVALKASPHKDHPCKTAFTDVSVQTHTQRISTTRTDTPSPYFLETQTFGTTLARSTPGKGQKHPKHP